MKSIPQTIFAGMVAGHCDLYITIDPFFFISSPQEVRVWCPGLGGTAHPVDSIDARDIANLEEPWRIQFHNIIQHYPGSQLPGLRNKFKPAG